MAQDLDRALIARFLRRRSEADFRTLYRRHTPALFPIVLRLVGSRDDLAEDIVQETWIRSIERLERFEGRSTFRSWLVGIAVNCVREAWRRDGRRSRLEEPAAAATLGTFGAPMTIDHHGRIDLERAIADLPEGYRAVLILHDIEGLTHEEIARLFDTRAVTSRTQLHRARRALRARLDPEMRRSLQ